MNRIEEYNFQKDVYTSLIRMANYRASGFLVGERKQCNDDSVFFYRLLNDTDELLGRAFRKGKLIAANTECFLDNYKKVVNDPTAYQAYIHQDDIAPLSDKLFESMTDGDTRFKNVFGRYWKDKCQRSVKVLYYRYLLTDPDSPKYEGLGPDGSKLMYDKITDFISVVKKTLDAYSNPQPVQPEVVPPVEEIIPVPEPEPVCEPEPEEPETAEEVVESPAVQEPEQPAIADEEDIRFLAYVYDKIVTPEFPASAILLSVLRSRSASERIFFDKVLNMDTAAARREMGIGEVSAKEVVRLGDMMRRVVAHPGTRSVYFNADKAALAAPVIDRRLKSEHIRVYHSYQKFLESCHGSMVDFYLSVAGQSGETVKFLGLNHNASKALLDVFSSLLPEIDAYVNGDVSQSEMSFVPVLIQLKLSDEQVETIVRIAKKCSHYPVFTTLSYLIDNWTNDRQKEIIRRSLKTVHGKPVEDLNEVAKSLNLSRERVRQLREDCFTILGKYPQIFKGMGLLDGYKYEAQSEYDFNRIREEEEVDFSNEYITVCIPHIDSELTLLGDARKALIQTAVSASRLYLVSKRAARSFKFDKFLTAVEEMLDEKRFYPYRDDLETFVRGLLHKEIPDEDFYAIVKECRQILQKGYPENIINSQIYFPANARKTIPNLIEDVLREYNRPMTAEEICEELNKRYPDLEQIPSKIGPNALRNSNIVAVSRSSTYALAEWNYTEKRGGTIRDIVEEYLNSRIEPIASLSDICEYVSKYRDNVKESSIKANLLAESGNRFSLFYKGDMVYIGFTDYTFDDSYIQQGKRQGRRSFEDSITLLEQFIQNNHRFPYTSGVDPEEKRLSRFLGVCKSNIRKGLLEPNEQAAIERIETEYKQYKGKKERVVKEDAFSWMDHLESYVTYINTYESLPPANSEEALWYKENKALYDDGLLPVDKRIAFSALDKIVRRM